MIKISRISFLLFILLCITAYCEENSANKISKTPNRRCCMTDPFNFFFDKNADNIRKRFDLYKSIGVDVIRSHMAMNYFDHDAFRARVYYDVIKEYDFRLKMIICSFPLEREYQFVDQNGDYSKGAASYWHPDIRSIVEKNTAKIFDYMKKAGLLDNIDYVIPFLGIAGEPQYPVPWATGLPKQTFWCYDKHAQKDFRDKMQAKYGDINKANTLWNTNFASWDNVVVLQPGTKPGKYWEDVLIWYRDTKRDFVRWSIDNIKKYCGDKKVLFYAIGHYTQPEWDQAVATGTGSTTIMVMGETDWLIDLAAEKNCWLQFTGVDHEGTAAYIANYVKKHKYDNIQLWGENAGIYEAAKDPVGLAGIVIRNGYLGLDYTHSHFVFEKNGLTPNSLYPQLREAFKMIKAGRAK